MKWLPSDDLNKTKIWEKGVPGGRALSVKVP